MRCLLFFILVFARPAQAGFKSVACNNAQDFSQIFLDDGVSCESAEKIQQVLNKIKGFAGQGSALTLFVRSKSYNSYGTYGRILALNKRQLAWGKTRPQSQNIQIWAHELGHTFFSTWLARDFQPIQGFRDYMTMSATIQINKKDPDFNTDKELAAKWNLDFGKARDIQVPYNELFADLVGVLYANDVNAMAQAMTTPGMPETDFAKTDFYAFKGKYDLSTWNKIEGHFYFAPVRALIGEQFIKFPMNDKQKASVIKKVYQACLQEIQKNWDAGKLLPSPAEGNKRLIETLNRIN